MSLSEREREKLAKNYIEQYAPDLSTQLKSQIVRLAIVQFNGNCSPLKNEQDTPDALGSGVSFEEFVIYLLYTDSRHKGAEFKIDRDLLGSILERCLM